MSTSIKDKDKNSITNVHFLHIPIKRSEFTFFFLLDNERVLYSDRLVPTSGKNALPPH